MSRWSLLRTAGIASLVLVLAGLPGRGWTEPTTGESGPPAAGVSQHVAAGEALRGGASGSAADPRPSSRRKQPAVVVQPAREAAAPGEPRRLDLDPREPVREILELRSKIGGVLEGTLFSRTSAAEEADPTDAEDIFFQRVQAEAAAHQPHLSATPAPQWPDQPLSRQQDALRQASWQLEQTAQMLEEHQLYKRADAIRALADELRKASRPVPGPAPGRAGEPPRGP